MQGQKGGVWLGGVSSSPAVSVRSSKCQIAVLVEDRQVSTWVLHTELHPPKSMC